MLAKSYENWKENPFIVDNVTKEMWIPNNCAIFSVESHKVENKAQTHATLQHCNSFMSTISTGYQLLSFQYQIYLCARIIHICLWLSILHSMQSSLSVLFLSALSQSVVSVFSALFSCFIWIWMVWQDNAFEFWMCLSLLAMEKKWIYFFCRSDSFIFCLFFLLATQPSTQRHAARQKKRKITTITNIIV